jgi:hypothetical protein
MIDKGTIHFDWISFGSYITGDGNVMTMNLLEVLKNNKTKIHDFTALEIYIFGDIQSVTIHVSDFDKLDIHPF